MSKEEKFLNDCFLAHLLNNSLEKKKGLHPVSWFLIKVGILSSFRELISHERKVFQ